MKKRSKTIFILLLLFVLLFSFISWVFHSEVVNKLEGAQKEQLKQLENSYNQGLDRFDMIAKNVFDMLKKDKKFIEIFSKAHKANDLERAQLRVALEQHLHKEYQRLYALGIRQFHIVLPNNRTFLRMHKPEKYDDDLTNIRYGITYVNYIKQPISGFEEGYTTHGFRHVFPYTYKDEYLGCIDISFSPTKLQDYIGRATQIHTHFIIDKNIFKSISWKSNIQEKYYQSIENSNYLYNMSHHMEHTKLQDSEAQLILPNKAFITNSLETGNSFTLYQKNRTTDEVCIIAFHPIDNIKGDKVSAYLVSYRVSEAIKYILFKEILILTALFFLLAIIFILKYRSIIERDKLEYELYHDALTGIFNRKQFFILAQNLFSKSVRVGDDFSIVMADIDWFKKVNDSYGHQCGDQVLRDIGRLLSEHIREYDIVARYGGEEFILLISSNEYNTHSILQKIQTSISQYPFKCSKVSDLKVTLSFGIAEFKQDVSLEEMISRADKALYHSKHIGRDKISFS